MGKKKKFNYDDFHFGEVSKMIVQLESESDRAVALIVSAWIDDSLTETIKRRLIQDEKVINDIFQFNSALGTFSSRIALGYLIRRFSKTVHDNLTTIRKIRNEFAHSRENLKFTEEGIAALCQNLYLKSFKGLDKTPRNAFIATGIALLGVFIEFMSAETMSEDGTDDYALKFVDHMEAETVEMVAKFTGHKLKNINATLTKKRKRKTI